MHFSKCAILCMRKRSIRRRRRDSLPSVDVNSMLGLHSLTTGRRFARPPTQCARPALVGTLSRGNVNHPSACTPVLSGVLGQSCVRHIGGFLVPARLNGIMSSLVIRCFGGVFRVGFATNLRRRLSGVNSKSLG